MHHVTVEMLRASYFSLKRKAAPGVDGVTWAGYGQDLEVRLADLHDRVQSGRYRAQPSKRAWIPKPDGRQRPLGIASLEDKIVQQAVVEVLNAVYETDFLGFSYGFRPGRGPHNALDAVWVGITRRKVNWVLDLDIRSFFDSVRHSDLLKLLEVRIADRRMLRLIAKWLRAGVSEDGEWSKTEVGTPQGAVASPLLANVYLHYVFDAWVQRWRSRRAGGDVIVVRYADDVVMGFQHQAEAERFLTELTARMATFGLELHEGKTRLVEFGRFAMANRAARGEGKPETFEFLGFTLHGAAEDDWPAAATEGQGDSGGPDALSASAGPRVGSLAAVGSARVPELPCRSGQSSGHPSLPYYGKPRLAARDAASQPERTEADLGSDATSHRDMDPSSPNPTPLSQPTLGV